MLRFAAGVLILAATLLQPARAYETVFRNSFDFAPNDRSPLGANLDAVKDDSTSADFVDAMKQSREWITLRQSGGWDTNEEACLDLDAHGYPRTLQPRSDVAGCATAQYDAVATLFLYGSYQGHRPATGSTYVVTWDGDGTISYHYGVRKSAASSAHRDVLEVTTTDNGWAMRFDRINPNDPIRNVHVWMPGYDEHSGPSQLFHPDFLAFIRKYKVLRFMDWMRTNGPDSGGGSTQGDFDARPQLADVRWTTDKGVPLEIMVELANRTDTDPWFNMPHLAGDDYMQRFAQKVRRLLRHDLHVYVEYSNEVWNGGFVQGGWVEQQGTQDFLDAHGNPRGTPFDRRMNWHGQRTAQMCELWKAAWGSDADRVTCVLGAQAANAYSQTQAADCPFSTLQPCSAHGIGAVAIAPYFGGYLGQPSAQATVRSWTLDTLFTEIEQGGQLAGGPPGGALAEARHWLAPQRTAADARGLHLISYEGGQHLVGVFGVENDAAITTLFTAANRDARMGDAVTHNLADWRAKGELFLQFTASGSYGKWGSWGAFEYVDHTSTPKHQALIDFIASHPCWWSGCSH